MSNCNSVNDVIIRALSPANDTPLGLGTFQWQGINTTSAGEKLSYPDPQVTLYVRKAGCRFGRHFHQGSNWYDCSRDPEHILFVSGSAKMFCEDRAGKKRVIVIDTCSDRLELPIPQEVIIPTDIFHSFIAGLRGVMYLELRPHRFSTESALSDCHDHGAFLKAREAFRTR